MPNISGYGTGANATLLARAVSAWAQQEYTDARYLAGTGLIGSDARISVSDEDYYGTIRWDQTLGALNYSTTASAGSTEINYGDETANEGKVTDFSVDFAEYIKSNRNVGASQYNITQVITRREGAIQKLGSELGRVRARDEDQALQSVLNGVLAEEASIGASAAASRYGQELGNGLNDDAGFFFDLNGPHARGVTQTDNSASRSNTLVDTSSNGGRAGARIFEALGAGFADLEPEFMYMIIDPETYYDMRYANLVDTESTISDGNIQFQTILGGKIRLFVTRTALASQAPASAGANTNVNVGSTRVSLLCMPGAISMVDLPQVNPVEFDADASTGRGSGNREAWYRWGYVMHPRGYSWTGSKTAFATNATYAAAASWERKESVGNLGMLPIFHS